jgi:hypothetical protein
MNSKTVVDFDPNIINGENIRQLVRLVFGLWKYRTTIEVFVRTNRVGLSVIDCAVEEAYDFLEDADDGGPDEYKRIWLVREYDGEKLCVDDEEDEGSDFLRNMLIAAEIISVGP